MRVIFNVSQIMMKNTSVSAKILLLEDIGKRINGLKKKHEIRFIDSFKFMASSLAGLTENLKKSGLDKFVYLEKEFGENLNY